MDLQMGLVQGHFQGVVKYKFLKESPALAQVTKHNKHRYFLNVSPLT